MRKREYQGRQYNTQIQSISLKMAAHLSPSLLYQRLPTKHMYGHTPMHAHTYTHSHLNTCVYSNPKIMSNSNPKTYFTTSKMKIIAKKKYQLYCPHFPPLSSLCQENVLLWSSLYNIYKWAHTQHMHHACTHAHTTCAVQQSAIDCIQITSI